MTTAIATTDIDTDRPTTLEWRSVSRGHLVAPDPNTLGTWHIWINTISNWELHYELDGQFTQYGPRVWIGHAGPGEPLTYRWYVTSFGAFTPGVQAARDYAAKLVA